MYMVLRLFHTFLFFALMKNLSYSDFFLYLTVGLDKQNFKLNITISYLCYLKKFFLIIVRVDKINLKLYNMFRYFEIKSSKFSQMTVLYTVRINEKVCTVHC